MKKINIRKNFGITLIALVVTIVVLLILAATSISMLTGENGVITQAQNAKEETRGGTVQEERDLWMQERNLAQKTGETQKSMEEILEELKEKRLLSDEEVQIIKNDENNEIKIGSRVISFKIIEIQEPENINDWEWYVDTDGKIVLTAYKGKDTEVIVPNYIDGIPVKKIGTNTKHAWYNDEESIWSTEICENEAYYYTQKTITKIIISEGIEEIADYAFFHGEAIKEVIMPETLKKIGINVFESCYSLISIRIPNSVTNIKEETFVKCRSLESIEIPSSVTSIGDRSFQSCDNLASITIPNSVTSIGGSAFEGCSGLTNLVIPDSVTSIGYSAFCNCDNLVSIEIPNSITSIGSEVFEWCESLTSITIPEGVTTIGEAAFYGCTSLTTINYTGTEEQWNVISIGSGNTDLTNATINYNYKSE